MNEQVYLEKSAQWYGSDQGFKRDWGEFHKRLMTYRFQTIEPWLKGKICLELGTADGESTQYLFRYFDHVHAVEGAQHFADLISQRFQSYLKSGKLTIYNQSFESFNPNFQFDIILAMHILEHLENPIDFLHKIRNYLKKNGKLIAMVPNALSLHRLAAVKMGLLNRPHSLNDQDKQLGHRRVYYPDQLIDHLQQSGLSVIDHGGIFLKPLTNKQIQDHWTESMMDAFYQLGKDFPSNAAEIYAICKNNPS